MTPLASDQGPAGSPGIGVIGAGAWGRNLIRNFAALGCLRVIADSQPAVLETMSALYPGVRTTCDPGELWADGTVDGVVVATTSSSHAGLARGALEAGKHVMVEKPLALSVEDAEGLVTAAAAAGRILMVGHLLEYHPAVDMLRDLVRGGELGEVYYAYSQRVNLGKIRQDENALWSFGPHDLSIILDLFGEHPERVSATGRAFLQPGLEDVVFVSLMFPGRKLANLQLSWLDPHKLRRLTLVGSQRMVVFDDMEAAEKIRIYDKGVSGAEAGRIVDYKESLTLRFGEIRIPRVAMREPLRIECQEFLRAIESGRPPRSDGLDGLRVVSVLEAAQRSLERGGVPVEPVVPAVADLSSRA
ncbi:MAG: Gfo/Idh/MocA family oxidoreductase [Candidatus Eiseniibacteriota bacterium]